MATGSGKTLIIAGTNIIDKTRDNFLNDTSIKYLFNKSISFEDKKISLQEVDNFQTTNDSSVINICFSTIQGLHSRLNNPQENSLTYEDFSEQKIVLISDEAHHINVETKSLSQLSKEENEEPVILFKSKTINESKIFEEEFIKGIRTLMAEKIAEIKVNSKDQTIIKMFKYFEDSKISFENLVAELQEDFSAEKTISVNSKDESEEKQLAVNTLEDPQNEYRVIFAVDKLNEGWDVLNLFDIVRLYDTRDAKNNQPGPTTIREAQLIGRGARYCPFKLDNFDDPYKRKFDNDLENEMRAKKLKSR
ncbi:hypothetical protein C1645_834071 [Glomus cerebriforme]|uniref:Helicase/UvrB N-terminal domain-containing protein n=1 Tax=Glomus cerebriforme TaxID=658196 RepID=A0A397SH05_9GLOM|nr:hypothetical protein C1645_834071 [Glomus cerebriforme]